MGIRSFDTDICRKYGISGNTFYRWRMKYGGMELSNLKRMKVLQELEGSDSLFSV
ncbi:transposase [Leptospira borgpetersenii serovar Ballum]|nr:transposase [Leptospira borgpetersenii serovar Ballum]MBE8415580.1 transposase [Leptospira borgpetersenii serovar Tarassovi]MBF3373904.1 transposase [Leptospira borgpetersenii serovar Arborea]QHE28399.1 transposase [Leptospira borgpetersenii]MBE8165130.1 transposase [Leptospira borgpetersenii serovar Ballum]